MAKFSFPLLLCMALLCLSQSAFADCTLVVDYQTTGIIQQTGDCTTRQGAQSTFKLPLALMGFDSGILKDAHTPVWPYQKSYASNRAEERRSTDPTRWEKDSVVWYSQRLTRTLGLAKFKHYVESFHYGNMDVSGDAGKDNGLTHAWLSSSLKISPVEQVGFIRGLLKRTLPVSPQAFDMTMAIVPEFSADGWVVHGKTGTGFQPAANGTLNRDRQTGWFVGWAEKDNRTILFAKFIADTRKEEDYAGPRARQSFLDALPGMMTRDRHNDY